MLASMSPEDANQLIAYRNAVFTDSYFNGEVGDFDANRFNHNNWFIVDNFLNNGVVDTSYLDLNNYQF